MLTTFQKIGKNTRGRLELLTSIYTVFYVSFERMFAMGLVVENLCFVLDCVIYWSYSLVYMAYSCKQISDLTNEACGVERIIKCNFVVKSILTLCIVLDLKNKQLDINKKNKTDKDKLLFC